MTTEEMIESCACVAHEANRVYSTALGETYVPHWEFTSADHQGSMREGVKGILRGATPREIHEGWLSTKSRAGWKFGAVKDEVKKEHPCFMPYEKLPPEQKMKDELFLSIVRAVATSLTDMTL